MYQFWHVWKLIGGMVLLLMVCMYLAGSSHSGHFLGSATEFARTLDQMAGNIAREAGRCSRWLCPWWQ